jgi:hypothetical protein
MQNRAVILVTLCGVLTSSGQGVIAWGNGAGADADNLMIRPFNSTAITMPVRTAGDTATYYIAALFLSLTEAGLADRVRLPFAYGTNSAGIAGKLSVQSVDPGVPGGTLLYFQVRAWSFDAGGADWATVAQGLEEGSLSMSAYYGESGIGQVVAQTPPGISQNIWTSATVPIDGFTLYQAAPEPGTAALVVLGLVGLVCIRRRK